MILIAFDVDGTLDTSAGPVAWAKVKALAARNPAVIVGIVSPSGARPRDETPAYLSASGDRRGNLRQFAAAYPGAGLRLYVSNNGDVAEAAAAGFAYITEQDFSRGLV